MENFDARYLSRLPLPAFLKRRQGFVKFLFVGSFNTVLDITLFLFFANILYWHPVVANTMSTGITMSVSYVLNRKFVFRSDQNRLYSIVGFVGVTAFNAWVVQSAVIVAVRFVLSPISFFAEHDLTLNFIAKVMSVGASFMLNFLGYRLIFRFKRRENR
ncbi:MAG: GtrA family protein [Candidatus Saccharimonadales bacterium]